MKKALLATLIIYLIIGGIIGGILIGKSLVEPEIITEQITIRTETIRYEQLPPEIVYRYFKVPVKVEVPTDPKPFSSEGELAEFLGGYVGNKVLKLRNSLLNEDNDCDDFAFSLRDYARSEILDIETEGFNKGEWDGKEYLEGSHLAYKVFIGNDVIIINPVTLEYWKLWSID